MECANVNVFQFLGLGLIFGYRNGTQVVNVQFRLVWERMEIDGVENTPEP